MHYTFGRPVQASVSLWQHIIDTVEWTEAVWIKSAMFYVLCPIKTSNSKSLQLLWCAVVVIVVWISRWVNTLHWTQIMLFHLSSYVTLTVPLVTCIAWYFSVLKVALLRLLYIHFTCTLLIIPIWSADPSIHFDNCSTKSHIKGSPTIYWNTRVSLQLAEPSDCPVSLSTWIPTKCLLLCLATFFYHNISDFSSPLKAWPCDLTSALCPGSWV